MNCRHCGCGRYATHDTTCPVPNAEQRVTRARHAFTAAAEDFYANEVAMLYEEQSVKAETIGKYLDAPMKELREARTNFLNTINEAFLSENQNAV